MNRAERIKSLLLEFYSGLKNEKSKDDIHALNSPFCDSHNVDSRNEVILTRMRSLGLGTAKKDDTTNSMGTIELSKRQPSIDNTQEQTELDVAGPDVFQRKKNGSSITDNLSNVHFSSLTGKNSELPIEKKNKIKNPVQGKNYPCDINTAISYLNKFTNKKQKKVENIADSANGLTKDPSTNTFLTNYYSNIIDDGLYSGYSNINSPTNSRKKSVQAPTRGEEKNNATPNPKNVQCNFNRPSNSATPSTFDPIVSNKPPSQLKTESCNLYHQIGSNQFNEKFNPNTVSKNNSFENLDQLKLKSNPKSIVDRGNYKSHYNSMDNDDIRSKVGSGNHTTFSSASSHRKYFSSDTHRKKGLDDYRNSTCSTFPLLNNQLAVVGAKDENLRNIKVDGEIFNTFANFARLNTLKNIETCGLLVGRNTKNAFRVTHLIIPKQEGTSDSCATTNEHEIFEYQVNNNLLTMGWIHTHPTQACFLSSVDLHTQCSYQSLLSEAIAIVIAPKDNPNFAIFRLSNAGMKIIQNCLVSGFHYHGEQGLYETCMHVQIKWGNPKFILKNMG